MNVAKTYSDLWKKWGYEQPPNARFKVGDYVEYRISDGYGKLEWGGISKVIGVNDTGYGIEYAVFDYDYLLWETQLKPSTQADATCIRRNYGKTSYFRRKTRR